MTPVSIHIRRGADANTKNADEWFLRAAKFIQERVPNAVFLVFSDGEPGDLGVPYRQVSLGIDYLELWAQSLCTHNITSTSTFAWWGA